MAHDNLLIEKIIDTSTRPVYRLNVFKDSRGWTFSCSLLNEGSTNPLFPVLFVGDVFPSFIDAERSGFAVLPRPCIVRYTDENADSWERGLN